MSSYKDDESLADYEISRQALPGSMTEVMSASPPAMGSSWRQANFLPVGSPMVQHVMHMEQIRASSLSESPFSPTFDHIRAQLGMRGETVMRTSSSQEAQDLRLKYLRGSNIFIFMAGYSGKKFIYKALKDAGCNITLMDGPNHWSKTMLDEGIIKEYVEIDFTDWETVYERALESIVELDTKFDAVISYYEDGIAIVARLAYSLGLVTNSPEACDLARNKGKTRQRMAERGLPTPKYRSILKPEDLGPAADHVGFPAIIKPVFGAASLGVVKVDSVEHLQKFYKEISKTMSVEDDPIWAQGTEMVMEEFLTGDEFDVDILLSEGKCAYCALSDNWDVFRPWFQETGTNTPSLYPPSKQTELVNFAVDSTIALGMTSGVFHVEVKYTDNGPRLVEVNARMGGMSVREANLRVWGVDLVLEHAMCMLGIPINPPILKEPRCYFAQTAVNAPYTGTVNSDSWLDVLKEHPLVTKAEPLKAKGSKVVGPLDACPDWLAEITMESKTSVEEVLESFQDIVTNKLSVPIDAKTPGTEREFMFPGNYPFDQIAK